MTPHRRLRKHLSADGLIGVVHDSLARVPEHRSQPAIPLVDALMAAFALFALKDPSLLAFDQRRHDANLRALYRLGHVPCDTQLRTILDGVVPALLRPTFQAVFRQLQRGKVLEDYVFLDGCYLLALDGTGYFSSSTIHCASCLQKQHADGSITYAHQLLGAALIHPDQTEVLPLAPEPIIQQDGHAKNDCERNAARRFLARFRHDHPHLRVVVTEDALSANGPHLDDLRTHGCHFILSVKEGDHAHLFEAVRCREDAGVDVPWVTIRTRDPQVYQVVSIVRDVPLNASHPDLRLTFVRCLEYHAGVDEPRMFTWITDLTVTRGNVGTIVRGGRARWKIENETFNTLKNQGYHYEHNFGHGHAHLSVVFALLLMLAFLVDQVVQRCDPLFRAAWAKAGSKRLLWERVRGLFSDYRWASLRELYTALAYGFVRPSPVLDSS